MNHVRNILYLCISLSAGYVTANEPKAPQLTEKEQKLVRGVNVHARTLMQTSAKAPGNVVFSPQWSLGPLYASYQLAAANSNTRNQGEQAIQKLLSLGKTPLNDLPFATFIGQRSRERTMGLPGKLELYPLSVTARHKSKETLWKSVQGSINTATEVEALQAGGTAAKTLTAAKGTPGVVILSRPAFHGNFSVPFDPRNDIDGTFATGSGEVKTRFMSTIHLFATLETSNYKLIRIPYGFGENDRFDTSLRPQGRDHLIIIQSSNGKPATSLLENAGTWDALLKDFHKLTLNTKPVVHELQMPSFRIKSELTLNGIYKQLGLNDAFDPEKADFSALEKASSGTSYLAVAAKIAEFGVFHSGSNPAKPRPTRFATLGWQPRPAPPVLKVDKPFLFVVYNTADQMINLIGHLNTLASP